MLVLVDGPARRVGPAGALLGRQGDCDLVTADPRASRRHALVRLTSEGVELVSLGREPATRNGKPVERAAIAHGDTIGIPGLSVVVELEAEPPSGRADAGLVLARARGGSFGVSHTPFVIGGADADLVIKDWPVELRVHVVDGAPFAELVTGDATIERAPGGEADAPRAEAREEVEPGELVAIAIGDSIDAGGERFTLARPTGAAATTAVGAQANELPSRIEIEILPRGGWVVFSFASGPRPVYLADRRLDLVMALVRAPGGPAGQLVSDDVVRSIVWPRNPGVSRQEINTLIARCRRDLVDAGLAGPRLIERAPGGGATRIAVAPACEIVIKS
jgi:hypothetical protein